MPSTDLGERLAALIRDTGRTQSDLAAASGVSQPMLSAILTGKRAASVSAETAARIGRAIGLSPAALGKLLYECAPPKIVEKKSQV